MAVLNLGEQECHCFFLCFAFLRNSKAKKRRNDTKSARSRSNQTSLYQRNGFVGWKDSFDERKKNEYRFSLIILIAYLHVYPKLKWKTLLLLYVFELWFNWARRLSHRLFDCCCRWSNFFFLSLSLAVRVNCSSGNVWNWNDKWKRPRKKNESTKNNNINAKRSFSHWARAHTQNLICYVHEIDRNRSARNLGRIISWKKM